MMKILVTGGSGCIGANLVKHLNCRGLEPRVLLRRKSDTSAIEDLKWSAAIGDMNDTRSLKQAVDGCEYIFHTAWMISYVPFACRGVATISDADDVAEAHILAAERGTPGERYIVGSEPLPRLEILREAARLVGRREPLGTLPCWIIEAAGRAGEIYGALLKRDPPLTYDMAVMANVQTYACSEKARRELGLSTTTAREAMAKAYNWAVSKGLIG